MIQQMKYQILLKKQIQKIYLKIIFVNKSEIRKKILKIRKGKYSSKKFIDFEIISKLLKIKRPNSCIIGGYYPYNYEIDIFNILKQFEKKKILDCITKNKKKQSNGFL